MVKTKDTGLQSSKISLHHWLCTAFNSAISDLIPLSGDAGFRSYYRFTVNHKHYLAVDAPPEKSNNSAFVDIQGYLTTLGVKVPSIIDKDLDLGFFCIEDLGDCLLADMLTEQTVLINYKKAINELLKWSNIKGTKAKLPIYDAAFVSLELNIFNEWLLHEYLDIQLSTEEHHQFEQCFQILIENATSQPTAFMHRDYHSRNIMVCEGELAVIDFQDAVIGPITYDPVSLLRDCYVKWPQKVTDELFNYFAEKSGLSQEFEHSTLKRWFDLMGIQRHIKASGIFARLLLRDNKPDYIKDIPLTLSYIIDISAQYSELSFLSDFISKRVMPALGEKT